MRLLGSCRHRSRRSFHGRAAAKAIILPLVSAAALLSVSCGRDEDAVVPRDTSRAISSDSQRAVAVAESLAAARDEWNKAEVVKRLSEAGLVVNDRKEGIQQPFLSVPGELLDVSESELQIFIYPSIVAREEDSSKLDSARAAPPNVVVSWRQPPHLIVSGKLLAIHMTPNEHLAERVSDALTARHTGAAP